jgi:DNA-binding beta-propeller fold protein YncE
MKATLPLKTSLAILGIVVLFLLTAVSAAATPAPSAIPVVRAAANLASGNHLSLSNDPPTPASGNKACPSTTQCTYVADEIGGVQVFSGNNLIASVPVVLTTSDPTSCPEYAYAWFGSILVADACGNNGLGELRVLDPATNAWGNPITIAGTDPGSMVGDPSNGKLYVANFGSGTVTVLSSPTHVATSVATCAPYPTFLDYDSASKIVFVGNAGYSATACIDMIKGNTAGTPIVTAGSYSFTSSDSIAGVSVNQHTGNVYVVDTSYNSPVGKVFEYGKRGAYIASITPPTGSDGLWGSTYDPFTQSVYVVSPTQLNGATYNATGFVFEISASNVVTSPLFAGLGPNADCYNPASHSVYVPNTADVTGSGVTVINGTATHNISIYGPVRGYSCGAN